MLTDAEFEQKVREEGYRPSLIQLAWMRWAFDLGVKLVSQPKTPTPTATARVAQPPVLAKFAGSLTGMAGGTVIREEPCPANQLPETALGSTRRGEP